jgi:HD-GYP domain-containing protein (c-di-GMP phosphodiesterase class II)
MMVLRAGLDVEADFVRHHHERLDGAGYPDGLAGEAIPFESRVVFVADAFEAMTSDRAYRCGMSPGAALEELRRCSGTQFDPRVVEALAALLERDELPLAVLRV